MLIIANEAAGSAEREAVAAAVGVLGEGGPTELARSGDAADLNRILDQRAGRNVIVAGGDGSLHAVVAVLRERGELAACTLGLLPLGTGNDFARSLAIPLDPEDAARVVLAGHPRRLDLLVDDAGGVVVNSVHLGVGALAARDATAVKAQLGRFAYPVGSLAAGLRSGGWHLDVDVDGRMIADRDSRVLMVALANGSSIGGGTADLHPNAVPDDGAVDVVVSHAVGPLARVGYAIDLTRGKHIGRDDISATSGRRVSVSGDPFLTVADGEIDGPMRARTWSVEPAAWRLITPMRE